MRSKILWCVLAIVTCLNTTAIAQPELDTSFGSGGVVVLGSQTASAEDVATQADNKVILVSECFSFFFGPFPFCTYRLNENGSVDAAFGNNGGVYTNIPGATAGQGNVQSIIVQNDGKIVEVGFAVFSNQKRAVVIRYDSNGNPDTSFGSGGIVVTDVSPGAESRGRGVVIQPDGKILVVGYAAGQQFVARYLADGTLDGKFGNGGIALSGTSTYGIGIALQPDGKILTSGLALTTVSSYLFSRFNADGSPDTAWDGDGIKTIAFGPVADPAFALPIAVRKDGRVVAAAAPTNVLYSFNQDGSADTSFGTNGSRTALPGTSDLYDLVLSAGGRITVVGTPMYAFSGPPFGPLLYLAARYLPDGSPELGFSGDGFLEIDVTTVNDGATAVALDRRGRIVIGGKSANGSVHFPFENSSFSAARLLTPPVPVGVAGRVTTAIGSPVSNVMVALGLGGTTIAISRTSPFGYYSFQGVMTGQSYTVSIKSRGVSFPQQNVFVADEIENLDIVGLP